MWIVGVPWLAALVFFPLSGNFGRRFAIGLSVLSSLAVASILYVAFDQLASAGQPIRLRSEIFEVRLVVDPLSLTAAGGFVVASFLGTAGAAFAWGGGPRQQPTKAGAGQILALLFVQGVLLLAALSNGIHVVIAAAPMVSALGYGILLAAKPRREGLEGASRLFTAQRIGDAALLLALGVVWVAFGSFEPTVLAAAAQANDVIVQGPLQGFTHAEATRVAATLLLVGCGLRLACFPWVSIGRHASGAPAPVSAMVVGVAGLGITLLLLIKCEPLLVQAGTPGEVALVVALVSACFHAAIAAATKRLLAIDLHVVTTLALIGATFALSGDIVGALVSFLVVTIGAATLALPSSAVIEAMQGQTDLFQLGGLGQPLRWTKHGRFLTLTVLTAAPGGVGFLLFLAAAKSENFGVGTQVVVVILAGVVTFAGYRAHYLQFGGPTVRGERPARLVEANIIRLLLPMLVVVTGLALAYFSFTPLWTESASTPLDAFLSPALRPLRSPIATAAISGPLSSSGWGLALVLAAGALGWGSARILYGQGPRAVLQQMEAHPGLQSMGRLLGAGAFFERLIDRVVTGPVMKTARVVVQTLLPTLIVAPPTRLPALPATAFGFVLRMIHNGDMQRGLLFLVASVTALLWWWSQR